MVFFCILPVHEIYLHLTWHTKLSIPLLKPDLEVKTHAAISKRIENTKGVWLHAIGGTPTHVHLAVNIEPSVTVSELVKQLKGGSSHDMNSNQGRKLLEWQRGYGVVSFGKKHLPWVAEYIANQKQHHAVGNVQSRLERIAFDENAAEAMTRSPAEAG